MPVIPGDIGMQRASTAEELKTDDKKWKAYVAPILGDTDMVIFAFGADIGDWEGYSSDNAKFAYYKKAGYDYFCNVDSSQYFVQITDQYFRQGRRNLDGYRMYYNPDMLSDLLMYQRYGILPDRHRFRRCRIQIVLKGEFL